MIDLITEIGSWIDRLNNRSVRLLSLHSDASTAMRNAVTETNLFLASAPAKAARKKALADLARVWTDLSAKVQTFARASNSDELRLLADECMALAQRFASLDAPEVEEVEKVVQKARSHDFAMKPFDVHAAQNELLRHMSEDLRRRQQ